MVRDASSKHPRPCFGQWVPTDVSHLGSIDPASLFSSCSSGSAGEAKPADQAESVSGERAKHPRSVVLAGRISFQAIARILWRAPQAASFGGFCASAAPQPKVEGCQGLLLRLLDQGGRPRTQGRCGQLSSGTGDLPRRVCRRWNGLRVSQSPGPAYVDGPVAQEVL